MTRHLSPDERLPETPSQTAGPYVHIGCTPGFTGLSMAWPDLGAQMKTGPVKGPEITITGRVFDGMGAPLRDAMVEIWQADADGLFAAAHEARGEADRIFTGWGRCATDMETGHFRFDTVNPGRFPGRMAGCRHHISLSGSWPGASTSGFTRGSISTTNRKRTPPIRS